jgi:hypothetical protein
MNERPENDRIPMAHDHPGETDAGRGRSDRAEAEPTGSFEAALRAGRVDLRPLVQYLASRVWAAERQLERLGQSMDRIRRRVGEVESQVAGLASRSSEHGESLRMMCTILKELGDPYGFGTSLDERIACDGTDGTTEEEA